MYTFTVKQNATANWTFYGMRNEMRASNVAK